MTRPQIRVFNTLKQQKVPLEPLTPGKLGVYVCGPTVYSYVHIGNARTFASFDVIVRYLRFRGFEVRYVRNYTDVDDRIIAGANATGQTSAEFAAQFIREFEVDAAALHLLKPDVSPKVSETIPEIIALIEKLVSRGVAYEAQGDVYFEVRKYEGYLKLSRRSLDEVKSGERVEPGEQKRDPSDFALWKAAKPLEPSWPSPWGAGRPGWHIECSAMSEKYLGETFDLHGGGLDLIFPHHENEMAQSEAASGKTLCSCWLHGGLLDIEGAKMSKSLGNVVRLRDALAQVDAEALRFFFLTTHYRQQLVFSERSLADAESRMEYFYETLRKTDERTKGVEFGEGPVHGHPNRFLEEFHDAMSDDFNFAGALGGMSGHFAEMNSLIEKPKVKDKAVVGRTLQAYREVVNQISKVFAILGEDPTTWLLRYRARRVAALGIDAAKVEALILDRERARGAKDFASADGIRATLKSMSIEVMDSPNGSTWKVSSPTEEGGGSKSQ
jgi:cysteinyl-tRNA synthetase